MFDSLWLWFKGTANSVIWIGVFYLPAVVVMALVARSRRAYQREAEEPFTDLPLRPPGESTRIKAEALFEEAIESLLLLVASCGAFGFCVALSPPAQRFRTAVVAGVIVMVVSLVTAPRLLRRLRQSWDYRLGFRGERVVAEELNRLLPLGYRVFHDVPFEGFNIDHVVVGPWGVFVVETKTRRKWKTAATHHPAHMVFYDGRLLTWPSGRTDDFGLQQSDRNARTLAAWLTAAVGDPVACTPFLTLPGWWVERTSTATPGVRVATTKGLHRLFPQRGPATISPDLQRRILYQLCRKCSVDGPEPEEVKGA